jgi:hypothetical protein
VKLGSSPEMLKDPFRSVPFQFGNSTGATSPDRPGSKARAWRDCPWRTTNGLSAGRVVLAVTGVEALYADMGHFGRHAISRAWHCIVLPCLMLNYLGLAAIAIRHPGASREGSLFFQMVPQGIPTLLLVLLATLATIIASQALISGVFSLTAQTRRRLHRSFVSASRPWFLTSGSSFSVFGIDNPVLMRRRASSVRPICA